MQCFLTQEEKRDTTRNRIAISKAKTLFLPFPQEAPKNLNNIDFYLFSVYLFCPLHLCQLPQAINKALLVQPLIISVLED